MSMAGTLVAMSGIEDGLDWERLDYFADSTRQACTHDADALLGAQPPPFVGCVHRAPFIARHTACADL
ncbi:MAG TPA: hypothetical protein VIY28_05275 [Pseudonocardiaceae bacterium]